MTTERAGVNWAAYRAEFPTLARTTFLNTRLLGALSQRSRAAVGGFLGLRSPGGASAWHRTWLARRALRAGFGLPRAPGAVAQFFSAVALPQARKQGTEAHRALK